MSAWLWELRLALRTRPSEGNAEIRSAPGRGKRDGNESGARYPLTMRRAPTPSDECGHIWPEFDQH